MKKVILTRRQRAEQLALANLTRIPLSEVTDAHMRIFNEAGHLGIYAQLQPVLATLEAERDGRDFTRVYWYRTEDGVTHLTLWDMNPPNKR
jgi:hypothetical protein